MHQLSFRRCKKCRTNLLNHKVLRHIHHLKGHSPAEHRLCKVEFYIPCKLRKGRSVLFLNKDCRILSEKKCKPFQAEPCAHNFRQRKNFQDKILLPLRKVFRLFPEGAKLCGRYIQLPRLRGCLHGQSLPQSRPGNFAKQNLSQSDLFEFRR